MEEEDAVEPQEAEPMDQIMDQAVDSNDSEDTEQQEDKSPTMIPLSVAQKLRQQKRELELELQWERQRNAQSAAQSPPPEDDSRYESATKEDLSRAERDMIRKVEEKLWIRNNPDKYEEINEFLPKFLKQRPNLARAIDEAENRYEEAYTLMKALSPKQQQQVRQAPPKKEAPGSPGGVPKAARLNEAVDVMNMSDKEFAEWRATKRRQR